jgi:hypothetical protein
MDERKIPPEVVDFAICCPYNNEVQTEAGLGLMLRSCVKLAKISAEN